MSQRRRCSVSSGAADLPVTDVELHNHYPCSMEVRSKQRRGAIYHDHNDRDQSDKGCASVVSDSSALLIHSSPLLRDFLLQCAMWKKFWCQDLPLCSSEEAPEWTRGNAFILTGYRAHYTVGMCLRSLLSVHNETGNVWTHLIGLVLYIALTLSLFVHGDALGSPMQAIHWAIFVPYIFGSMVCMLFSAAFHLFSGHYCQQTYQRMLLLDYFGITCLAITSFLPPCYLAFQCNPWLRLLYLGMISLIGSAGLVGPFCKFWGEERFFWYRVAIYCSMGVCGLFPMVHAHIVIPNGTATKYLVGLSLMMFFYAAGTIIYVAQFPERWFPGRFDVWLHSHQVWHVLVLFASGVHFVNCASMYVHLESMHTHC